MSSHLAPRLVADRRGLAFWGAACLIAFLLSFALGSVWSGKRAEQGNWSRYIRQASISQP